MFFFRGMCTYKTDVRNRNCPEGCVAEGYIQNECLTFCSRYLSLTETKFNRVDRNDAMEVDQPHHLSIFAKAGKPIGRANFKQLSCTDWELARLYVLTNCKEVEPFFE